MHPIKSANRHKGFFVGFERSNIVKGFQKALIYKHKGTICSMYQSGFFEL